MVEKINKNDECHACLKSMAVCPEKVTLYISATNRRAVLKPWVYAAAICLLLNGDSLVGRLTSYWQTAIPNNDYLFHVRNLDMPIYQHNRGEVPAYNKESWLRMMKKVRKSRDALRWAQGDARPSGTIKFLIRHE